MAIVDYSDKQVLLIDSSGNMRSTIFYMLRSLGVVNLKAITINERVLAEISENNYDVILLGHNVSDSVTGIQLLEECRFRGFIKPSACWIFMTSDASQEVILHAVDSKPDAVIMKPFTMEELKHRLDRLLYLKSVFRPVDEAIEIGDLAEAIKYCQLNFSSYDDEYDDVQLIMARLLVEYGDAEEAANIAEKEYWKSHDKEAGIIWAQALFAQNELQAAQSLLLELIKDYPLLISAYELLAKVYERQGDLTQARDTMAEATSKSPMGIPRQMELGRLATQTRVLEMASGAYRKSINLGRHSCYKSPEPYLRLANVRRLEMADSETPRMTELHNEFEKIMSQATRAFPSDRQMQVRAMLLRSEMYQQMDDADEANRCSKEAREINETLEQPLNLDRELLNVTGDAVPILESEVQTEVEVQAKKRDPEMSQKVNRLGVKHYLAGRLPQALKYFGLATEYDTTNISALLNLAQLFMESARDSSAKREERLRMVERYLKLASRMPLEGVELDKHHQLKRYLGYEMDALPEGPLGNLLR